MKLTLLVLNCIPCLWPIIENSYSLNAVGLGILWLQSCELYILVENRVASTHKIVRA